MAPAVAEPNAGVTLVAVITVVLAPPFKNDCPVTVNVVPTANELVNVFNVPWNQVLPVATIAAADSVPVSVGLAENTMLPVPVAPVDVTPSKVTCPVAVNALATNKPPAIPTPPATVRAPVVPLTVPLVPVTARLTNVPVVALIVSEPAPLNMILPATLTLPPIHKSCVTAAPPVTCRAPVLLFAPVALLLLVTTMLVVVNVVPL